MNKMKNPGKKFEEDFKKSAEKHMLYIRLIDPAGSFNIECQGCNEKKTRFSAQNICDAIAYAGTTMYLIELKSVAGKSIPIKNIVKNPRDTRLQRMADIEQQWGVEAYVIVNFRSADNATYAVSAYKLNRFIAATSRKSVPIGYFDAEGFKIPSQKKRTRYRYDLSLF